MMRNGFFVVAGLLLASVSGCSQGSSKPTAHLSGEVTINGQPIPENASGTIMFRPTKAGMANTAGVPVAGGKYDSPNTPVGEVTVFFSIQGPTGKMISDAGGPLYPEMQPIIPASAASGIALTVSGDNAEQNFDLK
jgi:hypothetical protein